MTLSQTISGLGRTSRSLCFWAISFHRATRSSLDFLDVLQGFQNTGVLGALLELEGPRLDLHLLPEAPGPCRNMKLWFQAMRFPQGVRVGLRPVEKAVNQLCMLDAQKLWVGPWLDRTSSLGPR